MSGTTFELPAESSTMCTVHSTCSDLCTFVSGDLRDSRDSIAVRRTTGLVFGEHLSVSGVSCPVIQDHQTLDRDSGNRGSAD